MSVHLNVYMAVFAAAYLIPTICLADDKFYVIAHMANDERTAGWSLRSGANAVEMDIKFDSIGRPTRFHHGVPCDCTCLFWFWNAGSVCSISNACRGGSNVDQQLTFLLRFRALALIYIDSKTDGLSLTAQRRAGTEVINTLETRLFGQGYRGKVVIGSGKQKEYIRKAASEARGSQYASRFYFTLDEDRSGAVNNLQFLTSLPVSNLIYSTGISICSARTYYSEIALAGINKDRGVLSNVFIWTLDKSSSFDRYFAHGARGILTNRVPKLVRWARDKGLQLATPGDDSLPPATTRTIVRNIGSCDCDYHKKSWFRSSGCRIVQASPRNTACRCKYKFLWRCNGAVVPCGDPNSRYCRYPDRSRQSCQLGGGDCDGY